jgi:hypothetical protein
MTLIKNTKIMKYTHEPIPKLENKIIVQGYIYHELAPDFIRSNIF